MYKHFFKRVLDILCAGLALLCLSPLLLLLTVLGAVFMRGNPFFVYPRAGKNGRIFNLVKFRSMAELKDANGDYLPDAVRLNAYGKFLRASSLDELPEMWNIFAGDMSLVGPRPLSYKYLDYYTDAEKHRHDVRPGLTGLAQINGRNAISWEERFRHDLAYVGNVTFLNDLKIMLATVAKVFRREGIGEGNATMQSLHVLRAKPSPGGEKTPQ